MQTATVRAYDLSAYDLEILNGVGGAKSETVTREHWDGSGTYEAHPYVAQAYIVWTDETDGVCFGPVRSRMVNCWINADGTKEDYWEASPFPGAWAHVPARKILRVRKTLD